MTKRPVHLFWPLHRRTTAGFVVALLILASAYGANVASAAGTLRVSAQGDCLRLRDASGLSGAVLGCVPDGSSLVYAGQQANADGLGWTLVQWGEVVGWAASQYLVDAEPATPAASVDANRTAALALPEPPTGGVTVGLVSLVSPRAVVAAQPFEVTSLSAYDFTTRSFLTYVPGSPVNAIQDDPLPAGTAVFLRRRGDLPATLPAPAAVTPTAGTPAILAAPAPGATVAAIAGTGNLAAFVAAQPFAVESISVWETGSQRWLSYIAGAPEFVSTLKTGLLRPEAVMFVKRSATPAPFPTATVTAPAPAAAVTPTPTSTPPTATATGGYNTVSYGQATITFYYCSSGTRNGAVGDGGGFCGYMANGQRVHEGAASCAAAYMGQRFLIVGDPLNRVYTCEDTGGAVTASHRDIWFADSDAGGDWWRVVGQSAEILVIVP